MKLQTIVWVCCFSLCACSSVPTSHRSVFPEATAVSYHAIDGRTWVLHETGSMPDGSWWLRFTPQTVEKKEWKELLGFGVGHERFSQVVMRKNLDAMKAYDPAATYTIEGTPDSFVVKNSLPRLGEHSVTRVVRSSQGYYYISYQERLGESGEQKLAQWMQFVSELPAEALLPEHTSLALESGAAKGETR